MGSRDVVFLGVSCGIPDFRSRNGLYASLQESGEYDLSDPQEMYVFSEYHIPHVSSVF